MASAEENVLRVIESGVEELPSTASEGGRHAPLTLALEPVIPWHSDSSEALSVCSHACIGGSSCAVEFQAKKKKWNPGSKQRKRHQKRNQQQNVVEDRTAGRVWTQGDDNGNIGQGSFATFVVNREIQTDLHAHHIEKFLEQYDDTQIQHEESLRQHGMVLRSVKEDALVEIQRANRHRIILEITTSFCAIRCFCCLALLAAKHEAMSTRTFWFEGTFGFEGRTFWCESDLSRAHAELSVLKAENQQLKADSDNYVRLEAENQQLRANRSYFVGLFWEFDNNLTSAGKMIRALERNNSGNVETINRMQNELLQASANSNKHLQAHVALKIEHKTTVGYLDYYMERFWEEQVAFDDMKAKNKHLEYELVLQRASTERLGEDLRALKSNLSLVEARLVDKDETMTALQSELLQARADAVTKAETHVASKARYHKLLAEKSQVEAILTYALDRLGQRAEPSFTTDQVAMQRLREDMHALNSNLSQTLGSLQNVVHAELGELSKQIHMMMKGRTMQAPHASPLGLVTSMLSWSSKASHPRTTSWF